MSGITTVLLNSGSDAFNNLFDVQIDIPSNTVPIQLNYSYSVRASGFQPPELYLNTAQVDYKAIQLTRQVPQIMGDRKFTIEFRLDSEYGLYNELLNWKHIWVDPSGESNVQAGALADPNANVTVGVTTTEQSNYGKVTVVAYNSTTPISGYSDANTDSTSYVVSASWVFYDVICMKVGTPSYQRNEASPVSVTAEFLFGRMTEPGSIVDGTPILTS